MRAASLTLLVCALLLICARLFTSIVYAADEPTAYLVLQPTPGLAIERSEPHAQSRPRALVLDQEEPTLAYGPGYVGLMHAAPLLAGLCLVSSLSLAWRRRRRSARA
jgi:hypothetical protein